jgi:hypothetical protein
MMDPDITYFKSENNTLFTKMVCCTTVYSIYSQDFPLKSVVILLLLMEGSSPRRSRQFQYNAIMHSCLKRGITTGTLIQVFAHHNCKAKQH